MTNNNNTTKTTATTTTPATTETPVTTNTTTKTRVIGSMQTGVDTSGVNFKSVLELRREFGDNWV